MRSTQRFPGRLLTTATTATLFLLVLVQSLASPAKDGHGVLRVSPNIAEQEGTQDYVFTFRAPGNGFEAGSHAVINIPAGWSAPQTDNPAGAGHLQVTPLFDGSAVSTPIITGSDNGPWTLTIEFSTPIGRGGFILEYKNVTAPGTAGVYRFTAKSQQNNGTARTLRSGSPAITVNDPARNMSSTSLISDLNPSAYGDWVTFTATVSGTTEIPLLGTVTFLNGDEILDTVALDAQQSASLRMNRLPVPDSPLWITAEYSGDSNHNPSLSEPWLQTVEPAAVTLSGLLAADKVYDGNDTAGLVWDNVSLTGVLAGDGVALDASLAAAHFATPNVGEDIVVHVSALALAGAHADNYTLNLADEMRADIVPALLIVTANDTTWILGAPEPEFTASYTGFVNGESKSVLSGHPTFSTATQLTTTTTDNRYRIEVDQGTLDADNYTFEFVSGWLTIVPGLDQPPRIVSIIKLGDGSVELLCTGAAGQTYLIQAASSLSADSWATISTHTTDHNGDMTVIDPDAASCSIRFYRTALP
jgi:hypothetical protein